MKKDEVKTILGGEYTFEDVDWCVQTGYPVEHGRLSHSSMILGLWAGDERAVSEMSDYMESHNFAKMEEAGETYIRMMHSIHDLMSVADARLLYEYHLGLPEKNERLNDYREELAAQFAKNEKVIRSYVYRRRKNRIRRMARTRRMAA